MAHRFWLIVQLGLKLGMIRLHGTDGAYASKKAIYHTFRDLGGIYVKFLQIITLNTDFLKGWGGPTELEIFEASPAEPLSIHALLQCELGPQATQLQHVDSLPFATGSFAQVYLGQLQNGRQVIIKVLRPGLLKNLRFDLLVLGLVVRIITLIKPASMIDMRQAYLDFRRSTLAETDYRRELESAEWFYRQYANHPHVVIPRTYRNLSTPYMLVQDYIGGLSLTEVLQQKNEGHDAQRIVERQLGSNLWQQIEILGIELLSGSLWGNFVPGDPHPGNVKLLSHNRIGLIDFGMVAPAPANRTALLSLLQEYRKLYEDDFDASSFAVASIRFFDDKLAGAIDVFDGYFAHHYQTSLFNKIGKSAFLEFQNKGQHQEIKSHFQRKAVMRIFLSVINDNNRFGLHPDTGPGLMLKSFYTYMKVAGMFSDNNEHIPMMRSVLQKVTDLAEIRPLPTSVVSRPASFEDAVECVSGWLSDIADRDPFLYRQLVDTMFIK